MRKYKKNLIDFNCNIKEALQKIEVLGKNGHQTLIIVSKEEALKGVVTEGDIRRMILNGSHLEDKVNENLSEEFFYVKKGEYDYKKFKELKGRDIKMIPVVDRDMKVLNVIDLTKQSSILPIDAILMAGGQGMRLRPLTENTPKPLLKVADKPIIQYNLERLGRYGISDINITLNYLGDQIEDYFKEGDDFGLSIKYWHEKEPLGTMGSSTLVEKIYNDTVLIMNSDLLTNIDYEDFYSDFMESGASISIASISYSMNVPYAVLEIDGECVKDLKEKPTYTYYSSGGIYLFKKEILEQLNFDKKKDAPDFIKELISKGYEIRHYPIRGYWLDIGKMEDFSKAQEDVKHISF